MATHLAEQALSLYDLPRDASVRLISLSENEIYQVRSATGGCWALRLQRPGYQSQRSLASEIAWLVALRQDGVVATPIPIAGLNGDWVQCAVHPATGESRNMVVFVWENGDQPTIAMELRPCFRRLGAIMASMHRHSIGWERPADFERCTWDVEAALGDHARWGRWGDGLGMDAAKIALFARAAEVVQDRLVVYGSGRERFGLAHCDLRLANLLLDDGAVKVIDFDDCGFSWFMADVASTVSFYEHLPAAEDLIKVLLEGYRTVRNVSRTEEEEIPTFVVLRRLMLVAWVGSHQETELARSLGTRFTEQTVGVCVAYLQRFG